MWVNTLPEPNRTKTFSALTRIANKATHATNAYTAAARPGDMILPGSECARYALIGEGLGRFVATIFRGHTPEEAYEQSAAHLAQYIAKWNATTRDREMHISHDAGQEYIQSALITVCAAAEGRSAMVDTGKAIIRQEEVVLSIDHYDDAERKQMPLFSAGD